MNYFFASVISALLLLSISNFAVAAGSYPDVPADDEQLRGCYSYALDNWEDGHYDRSPILGQSKIQAFCECLWHEAPEKFKNHWYKFSWIPKGMVANEFCQDYSNWHGYETGSINGQM